MLILIATWRNNGQALPDENRRMAHLTRATVKEWRTRLRPVLVEFFDISDGHWHQSASKPSGRSLTKRGILGEA
jgi:uncharacterized protein YdaU (DUF1376 family)